MPQRFAEVSVVGIMSDLLLWVFAEMALVKEKGSLVEMKFVLVFRRLSSG